MAYCTAVDINGQKYSVPKNLPPNTSLGDFIRDYAHFKGTKLSCREGACGACVVSVRLYDPVLKKENVISVNSCLIPVYSSFGLQITTVEGLGNKKKGYHPIQERLAKYNGTQCGYCSPGFVTSMYSLLEKKRIPCIQDVEDLFDGNICRCTGYRSILDAMKSFATSNETIVQIQSVQAGSNGFPKISNNDVWFHPSTIQELYRLMRKKGGVKTRLVFGNTSTAIFKYDGPFDVLIDLKGVSEMYEYQVEDGLSFGANVSLAHLISILYTVKTHPAYKLIANHIQKIANIHVRNVGSWAGNLMMRYYHHNFPSDLFVIFECIGVELVIGDATTGTTQSVNCEQFLNLGMKNKVILKMIMPLTLQAAKKYNSFKVMPSAQSTHAYVSGAFLVEVDERDNYKILSKPSIVFNGLSQKFVHAKNTEQYLIGQELADVQVFQIAVNVLSQEIVIEDKLQMVNSGIYRKQLALNLFYKYVLSVLPKHKINPQYWNASGFIERPISSGKQTYDTIKSEWPLNQPMSKIEAKSQCSGEAEYVPDMVRPPGTLYAAFVISTIGNAEIVKMDASDALKMSGVLAFLTYKDIPGKNICVPLARSFFYPEPEELFCSGIVLYAGQSLGLIVAERDDLAREASDRVKIQYRSWGPPVLTIKEALKHPDRVTLENIRDINEGDADKAMANAKNKISGEIEVGTQFHFHLETQVSLTIPTNEGYTLYSSTQFPDGVHAVVAQVLGIKRSSVTVEMCRLGGGFGGKVSRCLHTASACALAAQTFNKPVFLQLDLKTNLEMLGSRKPFLAQYEVGFDDSGKLEAVKMIYTMDYGCHLNDPSLFIAMDFAKNVYSCANWSILPQVVRTNLPANTYCRSPGSTKGVFVIETIMEQIAKVLNKVPLDVKCINMAVDGNDSNSPGLQDIITQLKVSSEFEKRLKLIADFNKESAWKKKGIAIVPLKYNVGFYCATFHATVSIFNDDGSVQVAHGGIECGQGINTKVTQVCAYTLGVPFDSVVVLPANSFINPNSSPTVASTSSELNCMAVAECCKILLKRIQPIRDEMKSASWAELIDACFNSNIDLCARFVTGHPLNLPEQYDVYGATCAEAEVDGLTGETQISRVDLIYDCGQSLSPEIDIGQIEGSFVMGMGLFLLENAKIDFETGRNITNTTWEYHVPTTKDIPVDFRVTMLQNSKNSTGVLKSKTAGEPPLCMSCSVLFAVQHAVHEFRKDNEDHSWVPMNSPSTRDKIALACNVQPDKLIF